MFTGIIEELGEVESLQWQGTGAQLRVRCCKVLEGMSEGASIALNGVCLTAVDFRPNSFTADLTPESLRRSNLSDLRPRSVVNLERPLTADGRLSGHIVQGHVDGTGEVVTLEPLGGRSWWLKVRVPGELERYLVHKGSVAIDGISLTVAALEDNVLAVSVIPHTFETTNLRTRRAGDRVNLECDILAKYVEKLLGVRQASGGLTEDKLRTLGY
jgi:riboflavin synthase